MSVPAHIGLPWRCEPEADIRALLPRPLGAAVAAGCAAAPQARPRTGDVRDALAGMEASMARDW
jgi:hypothetical protein